MASGLAFFINSSALPLSSGWVAHGKEFVFSGPG
jgi:hypothetical protein